MYSYKRCWPWEWDKILCYTHNMNIRIRYFASLREISGRSDEVLTVPAGTTVSAGRALVLERYPHLKSIIERCVYAVNRSYMSAETVLCDGDELVFIPPMGGGNLVAGEGTPWSH